MKEYMHYQEYFKNYLGAWSLQNGDETVTIRKIGEEEMFDAQTGEKKTGLCVWFFEKELPMVLNVTNASTIAEVLGTDIIKEWIGKQIILGTSKVKAFGKTTEALRVRNEKPKGNNRPKITPQQIAQIKSLIAQGEIKNEQAMLQYFRVNRIEDIDEKDAAELIKVKTSGGMRPQ